MHILCQVPPAPSFTSDRIWGTLSYKTLRSWPAAQQCVGPVANWYPVTMTSSRRYQSSQQLLTVQKTIHIIPLVPRLNLKVQLANISKLRKLHELQTFFLFCILTFSSWCDAVISATNCNKLTPPLTFSSSSSSCSWRVRHISFFLDPQDEVGPSISSSVFLCFFVRLVYIVVFTLVVCLCPSSVHVVAIFPGTVLFPVLCH